MCVVPRLSSSDLQPQGHEVTDEEGELLVVLQQQEKRTEKEDSGLRVVFQTQVARAVVLEREREYSSWHFFRRESVVQVMVPI